ncbi:type II toxin-antitoxin system RelE/ParE family toxin [Piscinibacter sp.]|uniref:type II toxin-antitoxin system RelE/ParE family toxin n=1 Tax=Piscinibacter sp. TaxID=1903157 RepID=UPI0039E66119
MARKVLVSARAAAQVRQAATWWQENRAAAPGAVATDFREAIALLAEQPGIGARYEGARTPGVRRLYLSRIKYFVYYLSSDEQLRVLAFWHESRGQQPVV